MKDEKIVVGKCYDNYGNNYQLNYGTYYVKVMEPIVEEFTFEHTEREKPDELDYISLRHKDYGTFEHNAGYVLAFKGSFELDDILSIIRHQTMSTHSETIDELKYRINQVACNYILKGKVPFTTIDFSDKRVEIKEVV